MRRRAIRPDDDAAEMDLAAVDRGEAADRRPARAVEDGEEGAFGAERQRCLAVVDHGEALEVLGVPGARDDGDGALRHVPAASHGLRARRKRVPRGRGG